MFRTTLAALTVSVGLAAGLAPAADGASNCKRAKIDGESKCLKTGQFCRKASASQYRKYGFKCVPGAGNRYRLRNA